MTESSTPPPVPPPRPKKPIAGKYELLEIAGRGGMSTVWRAIQHGPGRFRRTVAVKQMYPHLAEQKLYREMFLEEARVAAELKDPNIAQVHDFLLDGGNYYLVLEWIEGIDLYTYIDYVVNHCHDRTEWDLMVAVTIGLLRGLAAAHERVDEVGDPQPIIHRDVTPHNVLISLEGRARLIDFGLALARDRVGEDTDPGIAKGKFAYLAPEVVRGGRPVPASDQFSAGAMLWEALIGSRLFAAKTQMETLRRVAEAKVMPLSVERPELPSGLTRAVHRALSLNVEDRFPSVREMANQLGGVLAQSARAKDTYAELGRTVVTARQQLGLGHRPRKGSRAESPLPVQEESGIIELESVDLKPAGILGWLPGLLKPFKR